MQSVADVGADTHRLDMRESRISHDERTHVYTVDGQPYRVSVTRLVHAVYPKFDAPATIARMRQSGSAEKRYPGMSDAEIRALWDSTGDTASRVGRKMHAAIHGALVSGKWPTITHTDHPLGDVALEVKMAENFVDEQILGRGCQIVRSEMPIFYRGPDFVLPGTLDCLVRTADKRYGIVDWKRSGNIRTPQDAEWCGRTDVPAFADFDANVNYHHYSLQLSIYACILATQYGLDIDTSELWIVVLHTANKDNKYQMIRAADMTALVKSELLDRFHFYCARLTK